MLWGKMLMLVDLGQTIFQVTSICTEDPGLAQGTGELGAFNT